VKIYESELYNAEKKLNGMESETKAFLESIVNVKGSVQLLKNSLGQATTEQVGILRDGANSIKEGLANLNELVKQIKKSSGVDFEENERLRILIKEILEEESPIIQRKIFDALPKVNSSDHERIVSEKVDPVMCKIENHAGEINDLKRIVNSNISDISGQLKNLTDAISKIKNVSTEGKSDLEKISLKLNSELNELKFEFANKLRSLENNVSANSIKRY
jgi:hypothetical protein